MKNKNLAPKIKELRNRNGFSQEQLADHSNLSLRTIQRIESGESVPRGDTLSKLSAALNVTPDDILEWAPSEDKGYLTVFNLGGLGFLFHPLLGIIIPLGMWILKKDKIILLNDSGKKLINFQITFALLLYTAIFIISNGNYVVFDISAKNIFLSIFLDFSIEASIIIFLYLYNITFIIINIKRNRKSLKSNFFPVIPFLR